MRDGKPVFVAVAIAAVTLAANIGVAIIALSADSPPQAAAFGIAGLTAAVIALILAMLWAWRPQEPRRPVLPSSPGETPRADDSPAAPLAQPTPLPAAPSAVVIHLQEWLKARRSEIAPKGNTPFPSDA